MFRKYIKHKQFIIRLIGLLLFLVSCRFPEGLEPVSGVEGNIRITGTWPDSVLAASLIVLDELSLDSLEKDLISYSDPVLQGDTLSYYFIQLKPGGYYIVSVGLTVEPGLFFANLDSFLTAPKIPITLLGNTLLDAVTTVAVKDLEISLKNVTLVF